MSGALDIADQASRRRTVSSSGVRTSSAGSSHTYAAGPSQSPGQSPVHDVSAPSSSVTRGQVRPNGRRQQPSQQVRAVVVVEQAAMDSRAGLAASCRPGWRRPAQDEFPGSGIVRSWLAGQGDPEQRQRCHGKPGEPCAVTNSGSRSRRAPGQPEPDRASVTAQPTIQPGSSPGTANITKLTISPQSAGPITRPWASAIRSSACPSADPRDDHAQP